ncbi:hypothetical protein AAK938_07720 [Aerococcaceae bacterium 50-4]
MTDNTDKKKALFQSHIDQQISEERKRNQKAKSEKKSNIVATIMSIIIGGSVIIGLIRILLTLF